MIGNWVWRSNVTITVRQEGLVIARKSFHNLITTAGLTLARDAILGDRALQLTQIGIGAGNTAPALGDTLLVDERLRGEIIRREAVDADTSLVTGYVAPFQANDFTIEEIGWFGGAATSSVDTGTLVSRVLFNHVKNELESIQIDRLDTFAEAP